MLDASSLLFTCYFVLPSKQARREGEEYLEKNLTKIKTIVFDSTFYIRNELTFEPQTQPAVQAGQYANWPKCR